MRWILTVFLLLIVACTPTNVTHIVDAVPQQLPLSVTSDFANNTSIPQDYTCQGADVAPPLTIFDTPLNTVSLTIIMYDTDADWVHWVATDILPGAELEGVGVNSWNEEGYRGPCPPTGTHHYVFTVYALDTYLNLDAPTRTQALAEMQGHILQEASLTGLYSKQ